MKVITEAQRQRNLKSILDKASTLIKRNKDSAMESGDIQRSFIIADNEARMQNQFKRMGVEYNPAE